MQVCMCVCGYGFVDVVRTFEDNKTFHHVDQPTEYGLINTNNVLIKNLRR